MFGRRIIKKGVVTYMNYSNKFLTRVGIDIFFLCIKSKPSILVSKFKGFDKTTGTKFIQPEPVRK